jgi:hypothetical protein
MGDMADDARDAYEDEYLFRTHSRRRELGRPGLSSERRHIAREMKKLMDRAAELDEAANRFGAEPPVGTVVTFQKHFPNSIKTYSYAALRVGPERAVGAGWFLTGRDGAQPRTWEWLTDFIGDGPFRVIAPESGKSKFFNVLFDDRTPSAMVLAVDEAGHILTGVDPVGFRTDSEPARNLKPASDDFEAETYAKKARWALEPFWTTFVEATVSSSAAWVVRDRRVISDSAGPGGAVVATFPADDDGERRALQSAADRNRLARREMLKLETEPPVGARIRSVTNRRCWARREPQGWVRYNGTTIQGVRLSWPEVRRQLGRIEPGDLITTALFVRQGER